MNDQASALRQIVHNIKQQRDRAPDSGARVVTVTSGKGGVGKTNFAVNFAIALSKKGLRVLIVDADFGLANVDVVMGVTPAHDLSWVVNRHGEIKDVITDGPNGVRIISGGSGVFDLLNINSRQLSGVVSKLLQLDDLADVILFDTGAGISKNILKLIESSHEVIIITTPEPPAIMDAYALVKSIVSGGSENRARLRLVVNRAESAEDAEDALAKFSAVVQLYLKTELDILGYMLNDPLVGRAVRQQQPFILSHPRSVPSRNIDGIAWKFLDMTPEGRGLTFKSFLNNFIKRS
ncbi:MAG: MinD/ParA family protein [Oscillospiraceae bacterium]|nr:MinD/ParA family protein [Oscillospiraceae bacterium]